MKNNFCIFFVIFIFHLFCNTITVPNDYTTIQAGIDASVDGDTILVAPGSYPENINFLGKDILITSHFIFGNDLNFIEQTFINGSNPTNPDSTSTVIFCNNESENAILQGFTITGGGGSVWIDPQLPNLTWFSGGGIFMYYSSPTIRFNHITQNIVENLNNYDGASGGGLLTFRGNPCIHNNIVSLNQADYGAGMVTDYSGALIKNNLVINNSGGAQYGGGGFYSIGTDNNPVILQNNTIYGNHSETTGGAIQMWSSSITALNNIIWGNSQNSGGPINGSGANITFSCIEGGFNGNSNIDIDPQFEDNENFILLDSSPCIDAGNSDLIYNDPQDPENPGFAGYPSKGLIINDMGVYGGPSAACFQTTSVDPNSVLIPEMKLSNYPNPFNPTTTISFNLSNAQSEKAKLEI